jgi:hypothetical protein
MRTCFLLFTLLVCWSLSAQTTGFHYQGIARDPVGDPIPDQEVILEFKIRQGSAEGSIAYSEIHQTTTNTFGLFTLTIGHGTPSGGNISSIDWSAGPFFLEVGMDIGSGMTSMGTTQLLSVPHALYAEKAGEAPPPPAVYGSSCKTTPLHTVTGSWASADLSIHLPQAGVYNISMNIPVLMYAIPNFTRVRLFDEGQNTMVPNSFRSTHLLHNWSSITSQFEMIETLSQNLFYEVLGPTTLTLQAFRSQGGSYISNTEQYRPCISYVRLH